MESELDWLESSVTTTWLRDDKKKSLKCSAGGCSSCQHKWVSKLIQNSRVRAWVSTWPIPPKDSADKCLYTYLSNYLGN
jgi:hypothetical protein